MARSLSVLSKILGLTASSNPHEAKLAEEKLEQQLQSSRPPNTKASLVAMSVSDKVLDIKDSKINYTLNITAISINMLLCNNLLH